MCRTCLGPDLVQRALYSNEQLVYRFVENLDVVVCILILTLPALELFVFKERGHSRSLYVYLRYRKGGIFLCILVHFCKLVMRTSDEVL